jgi:hypothetical protein
MAGSEAEHQPPRVFVNFAVKFYGLTSKVKHFSAYLSQKSGIYQFSVGGHVKIC